MEQKVGLLIRDLWQNGTDPLLFVTSVDGLLCVAAAANLKTISSRLTTKGLQPYSRTDVYIKSRVVITLVQATHQCIQGSRVLAHNISVHRLQW